MTRILITGGTGLVGKRLSEKLLAKGYEVIILSRHPNSGKRSPGLSFARWNVENGEIDEKIAPTADHIIHLAGAPVLDKRWTAAYKKEILESRTKSSTLVLSLLKLKGHHIKTIISASAIGYYGEDPSPSPRGFVENDAAAKSFLGETCRLWEESIEPESASVRLVKFRLGIVLSNDGGAFAEFKKPVKFGVAGILGSGNQMISWIHIDDLCNLFIDAIEKETYSGTYNAVSPTPVTNKELTLKLAKNLRGSFAIPVHVPAFFLKLILGERSIEVLKSTTVSSAKLEASGFRFQYDTIEKAIANLGTAK